MSVRFGTVATVATLLAWTSPAAAQTAAAAAEACMPAQAPTLARPVKPKDPPLPKCVNEKTHTHTCRNGEIAKYNAEVERISKQYRTEFNAYFDAMQKYLNDANAYVKCELRSLDVVVTST